MADLQSGYNIIEKVGTGARSTIYKVIDPKTGKTFALKKVVRDPHEDTRFLDQAITEHEIASQTDHPTLRRSYDLHKFKKFFKLIEVQVTMEYVQGVSLEQHRPTDIKEVVDIFIKVAEGLNELHRMNYLHADLKPNNILVTNDGGVKIIDFGQGCQIGVSKKRIQGTPGYIAPEQVGKRVLTRPTDVFNFGATLYWVLTGRTIPTEIPKGSTSPGVAIQARTMTVQPPEELNEAVPPVLSRLVLESIRKNPAERPRDMKQVITRLEAVHHLLTRRNPIDPDSVDEILDREMDDVEPSDDHNSPESIVQSEP